MYYRNISEFPEYLDDHEFDYDDHFSHYYQKDHSTSTLVIHPEDPTTDFLSEIYKGKGYNVINDPFTDSYSVEDYIRNHRRIIALGHGCGAGLFCYFGMIIDSSLVRLLRDKELIFIWCNADQFMKESGLNGFYSGMFISEVQEAEIYNIETEQSTIYRSNSLFAALLGKYLDSTDGDILTPLKQEYYIKDDPVIAFNRNRLFSS